MKGVAGKRKLLRIFIDNQDKYRGEPLWEFILKSVKEFNLAGATVFKGIAGVGSHSEFRSFNLWRLRQELPVVIEIIDREEKIRDFLSFLDSVVDEGLITLQDVEVITYRHR